MHSDHQPPILVAVEEGGEGACVFYHVWLQNTPWLYIQTNKPELGSLKERRKKIPTISIASGLLQDWSGAATPILSVVSGIMKYDCVQC